MRKNNTAKISLVLLVTFMISIMSLTAVAYEGAHINIHTTEKKGQEPIVITENYTLTEDISFSTHGFIIVADDIIIDGAGFCITGTKTAETCKWISGTDPAIGTAGHGIVNVGYDNIIIKNLEIENFATGIYLAGTVTENVVDNQIENCIVHDNGLDDMQGVSSESVTHGIHMVFTKETTVTNNQIYNNQGTGSGCEDGGNGIYIQGGDSAADNNVVSENLIYNNAKAGIWMKKQADHITIQTNEVYGNGNGAGIPSTASPGGIVLRCKSTNYNTIENNHVHDNYGEGIFIGGNHNTLTGNLVASNVLNGIKLGREDGSSNNELTQNYLYDHGNYDVYNVHEEGGGNTGDNNAGLTAENYQDQSANQGELFVYQPGPEQLSITGEVDGKYGEIYEYFISSESNPLFESSVWYTIEWGDGETEEWIGPYESGEEITLEHTWEEQGTYQIRVKAKNSLGAESDWQTLPVTMPHSLTYPSFLTSLQEFIHFVLVSLFNINL